MGGIKSNYSIKDLENVSGVKAHTIRIWEKRYNLLQPQRTDTNIRFYDHRNLRKLLNIVLLYQNNYKISKIAKMSEDDILLYARELADDVAYKEEAVNTFMISMLEFDKQLFHTTYNELLIKRSFREIFKDVFVPFLKQIGLLWHTETLLPAHEHFISNLITQKIQSSTEKLEFTTIESDITYVLFLPENEIHELGLMYLNYELVLRGNQTIYLGQSLPLDNLNYFFNSHKKICYITSLTVRPYEDKLLSYFNEIDDILKNTAHQFIAIGQKTKSLVNEEFTSDIKFYNHISDLLNVL